MDGKVCKHEGALGMQSMGPICVTLGGSLSFCVQSSCITQGTKLEDPLFDPTLDLKLGFPTIIFPSFLSMGYAGWHQHSAGWSRANPGGVWGPRLHERSKTSRIIAPVSPLPFLPSLEKESLPSLHILESSRLTVSQGRVLDSFYSLVIFTATLMLA